MKRAAQLVVCLSLLFSLVSSALAVPSTVAYRSTQRFLELLDDEEVKYSLRGVDQDNDERVVVTYGLSHNHDMTINFYFAENNEHCAIRAWNLIDFAPSRLNEMYKVCNQLNSSYRYLTFYVDETDSSITVSYDAIFSASSSDKVCYEILLRMISICDDAIETLIPYEQDAPFTGSI